VFHVAQGAAADAYRASHYLLIAAEIRANLRRSSLKLALKNVVQFFIETTFDYGRESYLLHGPQRDLAQLSRIDEKDFERYFKKLERLGILARQPAAGAVLYALNRDWPPLVFDMNREEQAALRAKLTKDPNQRELAFEDKPAWYEDSIAVTNVKSAAARVEKLVENSTSEPHLLFPSLVENPTTAGRSPAVDPGVRVENSTSAADQLTGNCSLKAAIAQLPVNQYRSDDDYRRRAACPEALQKLEEFLGPEWRGNEGDWTNICKFLGAAGTDGLIGDAKYAETMGRIKKTRARYMKGILQREGTLGEMAVARARADNPK
jgi:hypothetical protein